MQLKNILKLNSVYLFIILAIFSTTITSCAFFKSKAKEEVSTKLRSYVEKGKQQFINASDNINLSSNDINKALTALKSTFGIVINLDDLQTNLNEIADKGISLAEPIIFKAIDDMSVSDAISLLTTPKSKAPMTEYLKDKTFDMTQNTIKTELEKGMELNNKTRVIKQFSPDISNIASKMVANKLFELIANEEKKSK